MIRDNNDYFEDIINSIDEIFDFVKGLTYEDCSKDKKTINAVIRSFEVIGEATKNITNNIKLQFTEIPMEENGWNER